jgi:fermentation-respiration switch protein FrsA (DUF1100 family)
MYQQAQPPKPEAPVRPYADGPALIIHGTEDCIIPLRDAEALFDALPDADKTIVRIPEAGHNDLLLTGFKEYFEALKKFVSR